MNNVRLDDAKDHYLSDLNIKVHPISMFLQ